MTPALLIPETQAAASAPPPAKIVRKPQLPALTGLRTLLACNLVLFHFTPPHLGVFRAVVDNSFVFVGFFLLLSGFVLTYNYADRPQLNKLDFWRARFARLYPIYLFSLVMSITLLAAEWQARPRGEFFAGLLLTPLLLQGWSPQLATFWNTVAWTLSSEAAFYFAFPFLVRLPWPKSPLRLVALLLGLWALGMAPHAIYLHLNPDHLAAPPDRYSSGFWLRAIKYTPFAYLCTFLAGVALGKLQGALTLTPRQRTGVAAASLLALAVFFARAVEHVPYLLMHGGLLVPLFAALTIGLSGQNFIASAFAWKPIELLGQASYALFLLHFNFINLLRTYRVAERLHVAAFDPWISYAATLALAVAAMYLVERPARNAILARR